MEDDKLEIVLAKFLNRIARCVTYEMRLDFETICRIANENLKELGLSVLWETHGREDILKVVKK